MSSRILTVMFTDIKGFTERTSKSSRQELDHILKEHEDLLMPLIPEFGGRLIKTVGDALMIVFDSPTNSVLCGIMMQERLFKRNEDLPEGERLEVRVAINAGEMLEREGDVFGEAVNIAARIEGITEASEIYFTESVYLAMNKAEVPSSELGMRRLKGVPEPIKIYRVIQDRHSDEYQQLLERLRTGTFEDVPVPTAGTVLPATGKAPPGSKSPLLLGFAVLGGAAVVVLALYFGGVFTPAGGGGGAAAPAPAPTPTAPADPVPEAVKKVDEALGEKEFGLALARADALLKDHPDREEAHAALQAVGEAEVRALVKKGLFDDALKRIEERRKNQNYVTFEDLEREVLLDYAAEFVKKGYPGQAASLYGRLFQSRPEDLEVHRIIARDLGGSSNSRTQGLAEEAAKRVAALTEGPLEEPTARALIGSLGRHDPTRDRAGENRRLLADRYPKAAEAIRKNLYSDKRYVRMNAYLFLKETGRITPAEELAVHVKNVVVLRSGGGEGDDLALSLAYIEEASGQPDWTERKKALSLGSVARIASMRRRDAMAERLFRLVAKAFYPEIKPSLLAWLEGDELVVRHAAFEIAKRAGMTEEMDVWAYHARNLVVNDYSYRYAVRFDAAEYFKAQASTDRAEEAAGVLRSAKAEMMSHLETNPTLKVKYKRENFDACLRAVEDALKALE